MIGADVLEPRLPNGVSCPRCGTDEHIGRPKRKPMPYRAPAASTSPSAPSWSGPRLQKWVIYLCNEPQGRGQSQAPCSRAWFMAGSRRYRPPRAQTAVEVDLRRQSQKLASATPVLTPVVGMRRTTRDGPGGLPCRSAHASTPNRRRWSTPMRTASTKGCHITRWSSTA